jgi:hypothetical protein
MKHNTYRLFVALVSFSLGLLLHSALHQSRPPVTDTVVLIPSVASKVSPTTFQSTGEVNLSMEDYLRLSDGAIVRFGCSDYSSAARALWMVRVQGDAGWFTKSDVHDTTGAKIGERIVWNSRPQKDAQVTWNEGAKLFFIDAPTLQDALTFEKSNVWKSASCSDSRSF